MAKREPSSRIDIFLFILVLAVYLTGQALIGTYHPQRGTFHFDAPADVDFLYYAGIIAQMKHSFPPQNPAYGGVPLSQSFLQYYPTVLVSLAVNPYTAMRILNVVYLLLLAALLRRYFPRGWGVGLAILAAGSVGFGLINSLGIDLVARGFNHFPFFIAFTVGLFETEKKWLRYICLCLLGWLHSFSALLALLYFAVTVVTQRLSRSSIIDAVLCLAGLASAAAITMGVADKPAYFPFTEGFGADLTDLWMHAVPALILSILAGKVRIYILFLVAFLFGLFFHYNPFFPVFILYYAAGWAGLEVCRARTRYRLVPPAVAGLLLAGFLYAAYEKYDPRQGNSVPHLDYSYAGAARWLADQTPSEAVVVTVPPGPDWNCRLMEVRALYLGFIPHVAHLGIDWRERAEKIISFFRKPSVYMAETTYVVYGPNERKLFPDFRLDTAPTYMDREVRIWKVSR